MRPALNTGLLGECATYRILRPCGGSSTPKLRTKQYKPQTL